MGGLDLYCVKRYKIRCNLELFEPGLCRLVGILIGGVWVNDLDFCVVYGKGLGRESENDGLKLGREMVGKGCNIELCVLWFLMRETAMWVLAWSLPRRSLI